MAKWYGKVGYAESIQTEPGVWEEQITERPYFGDTVKNWNRKLQNSGEVNDDVILANGISIVADPFAINNFSNIRYVEFMGNHWKVSDVEVVYPRLILTMGGLYHENEN